MRLTKISVLVTVSLIFLSSFEPARAEPSDQDDFRAFVHYAEQRERWAWDAAVTPAEVGIDGMRELFNELEQIRRQGAEAAGTLDFILKKIALRELPREGVDVRLSLGGGIYHLFFPQVGLGTESNGFRTSFRLVCAFSRCYHGLGGAAGLQVNKMETPDAVSRIGLSMGDGDSTGATLPVGVERGSYRLSDGVRSDYRKFMVGAGIWGLDSEARYIYGDQEIGEFRTPLSPYFPTPAGLALYRAQRARAALVAALRRFDVVKARRTLARLSSHVDHAAAIYEFRARTNSGAEVSLNAHDLLGSVTNLYPRRGLLQLSQSPMKRAWLACMRKIGMYGGDVVYKSVLDEIDL